MPTLITIIKKSVDKQIVNGIMIETRNVVKKLYTLR